MTAKIVAMVADRTCLTTRLGMPGSFPAQAPGSPVKVCL